MQIVNFKCVYEIQKYYELAENWRKIHFVKREVQYQGIHFSHLNEIYQKMCGKMRNNTLTINKD